MTFPVSEGLNLPADPAASIRTREVECALLFRVGVAIQTLAENKRSSTTMQELKNPCKIKAFSLLKGGILKKPCVARSSNIFRFWGEKSALGRRWGELGEKITVLNADDTYLRAK